jgi:hypothetical protein
MKRPTRSSARTRRGEPGGEPVRCVIEVGVGPESVTEPQRGPVVVAIPRLIQEFPEQHDILASL